MKPRWNFVATLCVLLLLNAVFLGQERGHGMPTQSMSMQDMMATCKQHHDKMSAAIDQMLTRIDNAKNTNDPSRMRAVLDEMQNRLTEMRKNMNACMSMMGMMSGTGSRGQTGHAVQEGKIQTATISVTTKGFEPASITLKPNVPSRVTFIRKTDQTCATSVVIPEYKITRELPLNKPVAVEFTPNKTGEFGFACGMNMLKGKLVVQESE